VEDGVNGFLAALPEVCEDKLRLLICDSALRERLGRAGRKTVEDRYTFDVHYPRYKAVLEEVGGGKR